MRFYTASIIFCSLIVATFSSSKAWADDMLEGQKLYQEGKFREAGAYFARAIDTNSYNAAAHYYLGNCFSAQKNYAKAKEEYRVALEETDDKKMESYCRTAIARLQSVVDANSAGSTLPSSPPLVDNNAPVSTAGSDFKSQRVKEIIAKGKQDAKAEIDRAEERCRPIMEEEKGVLAQMNWKLKGRIETTTADERNDAKNEFENKMNFIRKDAKEQARLILDRARSDATMVGRGLPDLDDLLQGLNQ